MGICCDKYCHDIVDDENGDDSIALKTADGDNDHHDANYDDDNLHEDDDDFYL